MQTTPYNLEKILNEFSVDELEEIVFKDEDDFDSFLTLTELTTIPIPIPVFEKNEHQRNSHN